MASTEPPSAATGLSGETIKGSGDSIGDNSKLSITGKRRAGSTASSNRSQRDAQMSEKDPVQTPEEGTTATTTPTSLPKQRKKPRFLSFLCCNKHDDEDIEPAKKMKRPLGKSTVSGPQGRQTVGTDPTVEGRDQAQEILVGETNFNEKATAQSTDGSGLPMSPDSRPRQGSRIDQPRIETGAATAGSSSAPQIAIQDATPVTATGELLIHDRTPEQEQRDTEIEMTDAGATVPLAANEVAGFQEDSSSTDPGLNQPGNRDSKAKIDLPPPPPLQERQLQVAHQEGSPVREGPDGGQKWLLPPQRPEFSGRKCLVLDLDETLVHSSFKVGFSQKILLSEINRSIRFFTKQTLQFQSRSKDSIIMCMLLKDLESINL
jgi:carboxy-terminal domain RNA polymerase II polypeptide A small phosphatase